jgi:hypothetical protein
MVRARERDRQAVELRLQGLTFAAIGAELGVSWQAAQQAVNRSLEVTRAEIAEKAERLRAMEIERLEKITEVLWPEVLKGNLRAIDRVLRTRESYRRLTALDLEREPENNGPAIIITSVEDAIKAAGVPDVVDADWTPGHGGALPVSTDGPE